MNKRKVIFVIVLLLVSSACGLFATISPTPTEEEVEPTTVVPPTSSPSPVPSDTPSPVPSLTPTTRPEGWVIVETENFPPPRSEHVMAMLPDGSVLLFGGKDENGNALNDTWIFGQADNAQGMTPGGGTQLASLAGLGWLSGWIAKSLIQISPPFEESYDNFVWSPAYAPYNPPPLYGSSMTNCFWEDLSILYGGQNEKEEFFNDMYMYGNNNWGRVEYANDPPPGRAYPITWCHDNSLYLSGGVGDTGILWDLWHLDFNDFAYTFTWIELTPPPEGSFSPFTYVTSLGQGWMFVDPHWFDRNQGNIISYNMNTDTWEWQTLQDWPPGEPYAAAGVQVGDNFHLMGGGYKDPNTQEWNPSANHWMLDLKELTWTQLDDMPWSFFKGGWTYAQKANAGIFFGGLNESKKHNPGNKTPIYYFPP